MTLISRPGDDGGSRTDAIEWRVYHRCEGVNSLVHHGSTSGGDREFGQTVAASMITATLLLDVTRVGNCFPRARRSSQRSRPLVPFDR